MIGWQGDMWGGFDKGNSWKGIIISIMLEMGDRPDLSETDYNQQVGAELYTSLPSMKQAIEAIVQSGDVKLGLEIMKAFFLQDASRVPAFDTTARQTRAAKEELKARNQLKRIHNGKDDALSFDALLSNVERDTGTWDSGIEARFKVALRQRFPQYNFIHKDLKLPDGKIVKPDYICEELGLTIEIDSLEHHDNSFRFVADRQKSRKVQALGYRHLQFAATELSINGGMQRALQEIELFINGRLRRLTG